MPTTQAAPEKFLPGRHLIEGFGNGGFRFGGMSHQGSLLIVPSGMRAVDAAAVNDVPFQVWESLAAEKGAIDFALIGVGLSNGPLPILVRDFLKVHTIAYDVMDTKAAARTYNVVLAENRRVAALLIAVDG
jgi:uncharacterized protein